MAESEFLLPHEQLKMSEKSMPNLAASETPEMVEEVDESVQRSEETTPSGDGISNPNVAETEDEVGNVQEVETAQNTDASPENKRTDKFETSYNPNNNVDSVAKEHPWTLHRKRKEKELMDRMGKPPEVVQQWICKQCGMETASGPLLELHIKAAHDNPMPELKCRKCEFREGDS